MLVFLLIVSEIILGRTFRFYSVDSFYLIHDALGSFTDGYKVVNMGADIVVGASIIGGSHPKFVVIAPWNKVKTPKRVSKIQVPSFERRT